MFTHRKVFTDIMFCRRAVATPTTQVRCYVRAKSGYLMFQKHVQKTPDLYKSIKAKVPAGTNGKDIGAVFQRRIAAAYKALPEAQSAKFVANGKRHKVKQEKSSYDLFVEKQFKINNANKKVKGTSANTIKAIAELWKAQKKKVQKK